jgi:maltooligosyltrehalose trehalohydrolase
VFRMRRGNLLVVVNFGDQPASFDVGGRANLLFETGAGVKVSSSGTVSLPPHAGALVEPSAD